MDMEDQETKRKLAAIFSADVKDYTKLMQDDESGTVATITSYRNLMSTLILQHHGRVVDSPGDNLLADFSSVVDAVQCAVSIQKELKARNDKLPQHRRMEFRIGINLGDVIVKENRIYGDGVNIAARLETIAEAGGICISRTAYEQIEDKLPLGYEYIGEQTVKNLQKPLRAYKVNIWPETHTSKLLKSGMAKIGRRTQHFSRHIKRQKQDPQTTKQKKILKSKQRFMFHLKAYLGIVGFLFIINILTYHVSIWFHWPALGWGLLLYLHWIKRSYSSKKN
jgi:class 3 adenylate cyclase